MKIDASDVLTIVGLGMVSIGLWLVSPALALVIIGVLLLCLGIAAGARKGKA